MENNFQNTKHRTYLNLEPYNLIGSAMKSLLLFMLTLAANRASAQETIKQYVKANAVTIKSVSLQDSSFLDLAPIGQAIGSKRVVMLGELFHGDGTTFEAKSRLIKYLHEQLGFNVLAFESDFFALNDGWQAFENKETTLEHVMQYSVYPVWTACKQCRPLFEYIKQKSTTINKLVLTGFDSQLISGYSRRQLKTRLDSFLVKMNISFTKSPFYRRYLPLIDSLITARGEASIKLFDSVSILTSKLLLELNDRSLQDSFYFQVLSSVKTLSEQAKVYWSGHKDVQGAQAIRDVQMANNLKWLLKTKYPNEKIIVWGHNGHIWKNSDEEYNKKSGDRYSMGYHFTLEPELMSQTYIIGFTEHGGTGKLLSNNTLAKVIRSEKNGLESWLSSLKQDYLFIDFSRFRKANPSSKEKYYMKTYIDRQAVSFWHHIFDGIFFIREMKPCEKIAPITL